MCAGAQHRAEHNQASIFRPLLFRVPRFPTLNPLQTGLTEIHRNLLAITCIQLHCSVRSILPPAPPVQPPGPPSSTATCIVSLVLLSLAFLHSYSWYAIASPASWPFSQAHTALPIPIPRHRDHGLVCSTAYEFGTRPISTRRDGISGNCVTNALASVANGFWHFVWHLRLLLPRESLRPAADVTAQSCHIRHWARLQAISEERPLREQLHLHKSQHRT